MANWQGHETHPTGHKTSEYVTEKNPKWLNKVTKSPNVGKRLFSGFLVSFANGVVEWIDG